MWSLLVHSRYVCAACREVTNNPNSCSHESVLVGSRWRAPRKGNDKAWKRIAAGDLLWDHNAITRAAQRRMARYYRLKAARRERERNG